MRFLTGLGIALLACACTGDRTTSTPERASSESDDGSARNNTPIVLATRQTKPWTLALDDENVYWLNSGPSGGVYRVSKGGGQPMTLFEGPLGNVESVGIDDGFLYFPAQDGIVRVPKSAGAPTVTVPGVRTKALTVVEGWIFWLEEDLQTGIRVKKASTADGVASSVEIPSAAALSGAPHSIVSTRGAVYASVFLQGILKVPLNGDPVSRYDAVGVKGFAVDTDGLYFAATGTFSFLSFSTGQRVDFSMGENPSMVAVDMSSIYGTDNTAKGRILRMPKAGGIEVVLAANQGSPRAIAADGANLYWSCADEGAIKKMPK